MKIEIFLTGLLLVSLLTGLVTEAFKKQFYDESAERFRANMVAGIASFILSLAVGVGYIVYTGEAFTAKIIIAIIALVFLSWLCAMLGYDKVMQTLSQLKPIGKE